MSLVFSRLLFLENNGMYSRFETVNIILLKFRLPVHPAAFIPFHESIPESCVLAQTRPVLLPLCKILKEAARLRPDEDCIGWQRFQRRATNESRAEAKRRLTWRTRQINSSKLRSRRLTSICFYRMRITLVLLYLAATLFQKIKGHVALGGNLRDLFSLLWGSVLPLPFLLRSRSDAFSHLKRHLNISASRNIQTNG